GRTARVTFTPPPSSSVDGYVVTSNPDGQTASGYVTAPDGHTPTSIDVRGLSNGTPYTFTVHASSIIHGDGPDSAPSNSVTPRTYSFPGAPTNVVATKAGSGKIALSFDAPDDDGGTPIVSYRVTNGFDQSEVAMV